MARGNEGIRWGRALVAALIVEVLVIAAYWLSPEQVPLRDSVSLTNIASYLLRFAGGAAGGYLIARKKAAGAASTFE